MVLAVALLASALFYRSRPQVIPSADETAVFEAMRAETRWRAVSKRTGTQSIAWSRRGEIQSACSELWSLA